MTPSPALSTWALSLAGSWRLRLDANDAGLAEQWFATTFTEQQTAKLPGSLATQRIGNDVTVDTPWTGTIFDRSFYESPDYAPYRRADHVRVPFFLQPEKVYVGPAWYQREIEVPADWSGQRLVLTLERPHGQTTVWCDDRELGSQDSLATPHVYELGSALAPGRHRLTLRIDNRLLHAVGENAHSVSDQTQGNWNGCVGRMEIRATAPTWIDDVQVTTHVERRAITVRGTVRGDSLSHQTVTLTVGDIASATTPSDDTGAFTATLELGPDAALWDEFTPVLHTLVLTLPHGERHELRFGLREISTRGTQFILNGQPIFFRGTLDCCIFPLTGHPPMDVAAWRKLLGTVQAHGLNHVRFHSWCPPEAAFVAGDELGVYFQIEAGVWPNSVAVLAFNSPAGIGDGASVDAWTIAESERIVSAYGNHPCFVLMAAGNEPGGPHHRAYLARWLTHLRAHDPRRLYTGTAGWPELPENEFHVIPAPRGHQWGDGLKSRLNALPPATTANYRELISARHVPVISHEIGQWCAYPTLDDAPKYTGHLRPTAYEIFADSLAAHHLADRVSDFVHASGRLQALCYKEEIESALRTPGMGGFQLLNLQDFPGQGTAPIGVINALAESKGYIAPAEFRRFCGAVVPLARLEKRIFTTEETFVAEIEVAWFGSVSPAIVVATWSLVGSAGDVFLRGQLPPRSVTAGGTNSLGRIAIPLHHLPAPSRYRLVVELEGSRVANDWELWVYPATLPALPANDILITDSFSAAREALAAGSKVLFLPSTAKVTGDVALGFTPIFWNTACTQRQAPHTLGIWCDPAHPALAEFPTESHTNWQWWYLVSRAAAIVLDPLPPTLRPIVQVIDDWFTNRRLGLVFEARVGAGKLLVCSIDLTGELAENPVARQLRASLLRHLTSEAFNPSDAVTVEALAALFPN